MIIETIKKAIEVSGKSRYQIGQETGIDNAVLSRIVNGGSCSLETADKLFEYLGITIELPPEGHQTTIPQDWHPFRKKCRRLNVGCKLHLY